MVSPAQPPAILALAFKTSSPTMTPFFLVKTSRAPIAYLFDSTSVLAAVITPPKAETPRNIKNENTAGVELTFKYM
jgi:hypothetical protein